MEIRSGDEVFDKRDRGSGSLKDYAYNLVPRSRKTVIRLAGSDGYQDELRTINENDDGELETAISHRTIEEERVDAPIEVRLFTGRRVSGVVGIVPRGLEPAIEEALTRLENAGKKARIPVNLVSTRNGLRVDLLMGATR
jgi:hypothetical protein